MQANIAFLATVAVLLLLSKLHLRDRISNEGFFSYTLSSVCKPDNWEVLYGYKKKRWKTFVEKPNFLSDWLKREAA